MGLDNEKKIYDAFKSVIWLSMVIAGFLIVDKLSMIEKKLEKLDSIDSRVIRIEYELKLRPN